MTRDEQNEIGVKKKSKKGGSATGKGEQEDFNDNPAGPESNSPSSIYYMHSLLLYSGRLLHKVLDVYNSLFSMDTKDKAKIYSNISTHYLNKGLHDRALQYLKEWTSVEPSNPDAFYRLGIALASTGNAKSAMNAYDKVLKINPNHKGAIYRQSSIMLKQKDYEGAVKGLEKAAELAPNSPKVFYLLGVAHEGMEAIDKAIEAMQKAIDLDPDEIKYHQHLGFLNVRKDDHKTAAISFTKVMQLEREHDEFEEEY